MKKQLKTVNIPENHTSIQYKGHNGSQ